MRIVALSDVHGQWDRLTVPAGDVLIVAGDLCDDEPEERTIANDWLASLQHAIKLYVPGNHDLGAVYDAGLFPAVKVLVDEIARANGLTIYGAPWESRERRDWVRHIPEAIDVLVTHEPPYNVRDWSFARGNVHLGNRELRERVRQVRPRLHIFGHCHDGFGVEERDGTIFANVAICDRNYSAAHDPTVIDVGLDGLRVAGLL